MTISDFPQELIDYIIYYLANDKPALSRTALVCRKWFSTSQSLLFRSLNLLPYDISVANTSKILLPSIGMRDLELILKRSPHIKSHIKKLTINTPYLLSADPFILAVSTLISGLPSLNHLVLKLARNKGCASLLHMIRGGLQSGNVLPRTLQNLDILFQAGVHGDVLRVLEGANIRRFRLIETGISVIGGDADHHIRPCAPVTSVEELHFSLSAEPFISLSDLCPLAALFPNLNKVTLYIGAVEEFRTVTRLIGTPGLLPVKLEMLCIVTETDDVYYQTRLPSLDLNHVSVTHLVIIDNTIAVQLYRDELLSHMAACINWWATNIQNTAPSHHPEKLTLIFQERIEEEDSQSITAALHNLDLVVSESSVAEVVIEMLGSESSNPGVRNTARQWFSKSAQKGMLRTGSSSIPDLAKWAA